MTPKAILTAPTCATVCFAGTLPTPRPHPRLQIDAALLQQIRTLRDQVTRPQLKQKKAGKAALERRGGRKKLFRLA